MTGDYYRHKKHLSDTRCLPTLALDKKYILFILETGAHHKQNNRCRRSAGINKGGNNEKNIMGESPGHSRRVLYHGVLKKYSSGCVGGSNFAKGDYW